MWFFDACAPSQSLHTHNIVKCFHAERRKEWIQSFAGGKRSVPHLLEVVPLLGAGDVL